MLAELLRSAGLPSTRGLVCYSPHLWEGNGGFASLQQTVPRQRVALLLGRTSC